jgi:hypothetical protein
MVVSPCTTFTLPEKVASFFLSRISSVAASIWIGWSRFCEKPCMALGTPVHQQPIAAQHILALGQDHAAEHGDEIGLGLEHRGVRRSRPGPSG